MWSPAERLSFMLESYTAQEQRRSLRYCITGFGAHPEHGVRRAAAAEREHGVAEAPPGVAHSRVVAEHLLERAERVSRQHLPEHAALSDRTGAPRGRLEAVNLLPAHSA